MAVKVKWTGNAANLPKERKSDTTPTVRYVGMGPGGNTYQPYLKTDDTAGAVKSTVKNDQQGKFDAGQYAGDAGKLFLNGIAGGIAGTGAFVEDQIGKVLDKLFPGAGFEGSGVFNALYNGRPDWKWAGENGLVGIKQDTEYNMEHIRENAERTDSKILQKAAEFGGDTAYALGNALPMAAEAAVTGGASMAANLTKEGLLKTGAEVVEKSGVLNTLSKAAREMLTSKDYWTSFASEVGMDYYDALDNGATEDEALRYALSSAGLNSVIEIGGGIQKIPERPTFRTWLKSANEEGMEEVQQGIVSRLLENTVYNKGNPIASLTDDDAILNPVTALGEYAGGAAVGGILSGGQQLTQRAINRSVRAEQNKQAKKVYGDSAQDLVAESLELNPNNELATRLQEKLDNSEDLTGDDLRQLVEQNENSMVASDKASIQSAVENRLSELGATNNVSKMAEIITQQISGEDVADSDRHLVESSKAGRQVRQELNPENIRVGAENEAWTGNIGTARINTTAYNRDMQKTGVTGAKYNAETGRLDAIVTNEAGEVKTVPAAEAEMTPMQEELFDWADELKPSAAGPLMVRAYQPEQNVELYTRSFKLAYEYGKAGMPMDYVEKSEGVNYLHPTQIKLAYEEGQAATQRKVQAREEKIRSGGTTDSTTKKKGSVSLRGAKVGSKTYAPVNRKTVDSRQWASVKAMRAFSRAVGVDVVFYQSQANERGVYEGANGFYKDGKLYLDINAGRDTVGMTETAILKTAAHELTHFIQANSAQYEALKSFVVNKLTHEEGVSFEDLVADKQRREPGLEYDEAVDEVVADACEMMLGNSTVVEQLAKENRSLAEKIRDWLREWVENLKIALEGLQADRTESRAMMQYAWELQEIWDNALMDAARNNRGAVEETAPAESRQSIRETSDGKKYVKADRQVLFGSDPDSWSEQLEDYINGKIRRGQDVQLIAEDGDVLLLTRTSAGKLSDNHTSDGRTMSDAAFERKANAAAHIDELVEVSSKGKKTIIDKDARHGDMASGGWNYRTAYFMDFDGKYYKTTISVAEGAGGSIVYNVGKMQERSTPQIDGSSGKAGALRGNASTNSIRQSNDNSQEKSSDKVQSSMRDSSGRELTEAQRAYFKDSKVRDADGNLLVMYHQTDGTFTVFDTKHKGAGAGDDETPFGIFLKRTPRNIGVRGEKQMELYADIRNPLRVRDRTELVSKLRELSVDYARLKDESAQIDKEYGAKFEEAKNAFKSFLIQWRKNNPDAPPRAAYDADGFDAAFNAEDNVVKEWTRAKDELALRAKTSITQALRDNGYDGVILENDKGSWGRSTDAYIALDANQVKNTTNKTPTADPDIRYQQRDNLKEEYHLTDDEESAIISYKSGDSYTLNGKLTAKAELTEYQRKLRDNLDAALEKLPVYRGEVYRHYNFDDFGGFEAMKDFLSLFKNGRHIELGGYLSCSTMRNEDRTKGKYTVNMVIQSENGRKLAGFGRNTENEILLPRNTRLVPYQMERMGPTGIRIYVREETISETGKANDSTLPGVLQVREGTQRGKDLQQVPGGDSGKVQREMGRSAGRDGDRGGMPGLREGEGSRAMDPSGVAENYGRTGTRGGEGEGVKKQQREPRLSDRDVLSLAAEMALRQQNKSWTPEDRNRLEIFTVRLRRLEEAQAELKTLKQERKDLLDGRKASEVTKDERLELTQNKNRTDLAKKNVEKREAQLYEIESIEAVKTLLRKSREVVEKETAFKARQRYREKTEDRQRYQVLKRRLERTTNEWKRMLLKPTKDRYAPEELVRSCLEVALMLDESGPREGTKSKYRYETTSEALAYMKKQYDALTDSEDQFYRLGYDKELSELVEQLKDALDGKAIRDLTYEEAGDVAAVLVSMQGILKDARYQIGSLERISTQELVDSAVQQMQQMPGRTKAEAATDAVARQSASVMRNIRRMCQYNDNAALYKLFRQLEEGVKKKDRFIMKANKLFDRFAGDRMLKSATELKTYHVSGVDVKMTEMEVMQLILSAKRELSDKTRHLEGKGFIVPDLELMRKGRGQDAISHGQEVRKTFLKDILQLENGLDDWAKDYMHTASEFFNGMARNAINEATVQTKHRRMAVTKDYIPSEVDKRTVVKDIDGVKFDATIEGDGMLKSVVAGAQNPLIIRGLNTIVENHIERVGRIYGLAVPIRNFNKAYNAKSQKGQGMSMKEAITRAWPAADTKLIEQAITDLQTSRERSTSDVSKLMRKAEGKFVEATLLSNISVTIKQAASYSTAGLYLSQKALFPYQTTIARLFAADNSAFAKKLFAEIDEHTPMHYMRRKGMSMEEAATVAKDNSKVVRWMDKKLPDVANPLKWIQNMDVATTAAIWLATKRQVELDGVKQSDPTYWSRVTELYEKVISETQPMYDSLHRPEVQKNTDELVRGLMMFRTQPLQNAGILYDAAGEMAQAKKNGYPEQIKAANRKFRMAVGSQVASLAVFATMTLLAYAVRNRLGRYRDDEEEVTVASVMKRVLGDMAVNGAQLLLPIGGGVVAGGIEKVITGSSYGGTLSIPTLDAINDWVSQMDRVRQDIVKLSEDEEADIVTDSVDFAMDTAGMLGIPAKNAFGILRGVVGNITDITGHEVSWATDKPAPSMAIVKACFENGHMEKGREVIDQVIQSKMDTGKEEKEARSAVRSSLTAYYKKLYLKAYKRNDNEEMERIRMVIQGSRMYDDNAADVAAGWVKKWAEEEKKKEKAKKK